MPENHARNCECPSCARGTSRRDFIAGAAASLGVLGAAALLPSSPFVSAAFAQAAAPGQPWMIDVHQHFMSPGMLEEVVKRDVGNPVMRKWTPQMSLDDMGKAGTAIAMLSLGRPGVWFGDVPLARKLARESNEYAAKVISDYPKRFGLFAMLPIPDVDGSLKEIEYAYETLKADGIAVMSNYDNSYLGDPKIAPIMDELNRRKAIVFEHPLQEDRNNPLNGVELVTETTRTIHSLLYNATVVRCPDIRFIFSHGGGTIAMAASRLGIPRETLPKGVMYELRKFYYDCAGIVTPYQLPSVKALVPLPHFLFGTDSPFGPGAAVVEGLTKNGGFTEAELRAIEHDNAVALMPRLKS